MKAMVPSGWRIRFDFHVAGRAAGLHNVSVIRRMQLSSSRLKVMVYEVHLLARLRQLIRRPVSHDVIVGFIVGRDFNQFDFPFAPLPFGVIRALGRRS